MNEIKTTDGVSIKKRVIAIVRRNMELGVNQLKPRRPIVMVQQPIMIGSGRVVMGKEMSQENPKNLGLIEFLLMPMGVLTTGSVHARPSTRAPIDMSEIFSAHMSAKPKKH